MKEGSTLAISRRDFVKTSVALGGGLLLGIQPAGAAEGSAELVSARNPAGFIHIGSDDTITLTIPGVEMGQGSHTALPMIIMDELEGDWSKMRFENAAVADIYKNPMVNMQATFGSFNVRGWYYQLRDVGAAARRMLVEAAAAEWRVPAAEIESQNSILSHPASGRQATYGQFAERAATLPRPEQPPLKSPGEFRFMGKPMKRTDTIYKVDGSAIFGIDVALPDMLYATVKVCPSFGGTLKSFDVGTAREVAGFHTAVALDNGVAAVATSYWRARKALAKIRVDYDPGPIAGLNSEQVSAALRQGLEEPGDVFRSDGDAPAVLAEADSVIEASYEVPYLAHACLEPMNCTAQVTDTGCEIWVGSQAPERARDTAAELLGLPKDKVKVHTQYLGGGFGRRGAADFVAQAALIAKAVPGRPVKLIWSREEDIQHDLYRPAVASRYRACLDKDGKLTALSCKIATSATPAFNFPGPPIYTRGVVETPYAVPNLQVSGLDKALGVPFGFWRAVPHSHTPFGIESFIDEVAHAAGQDPYQFRRDLLQGEKASRYLRVLDLAAEKAGWGDQLPQGHSQGIAVVEAYGSYLASVAEVSVNEDRIRVHRVVCGFDCGINVDPETTRAQIEGGLVWGLTAALRGEITIDKGAVVQSNFHDYPMSFIKEMPEVEAHIVDSTEFPGGVGEPGAAPIAPALSNAIFAATGKRIRSLPLSKHGLT
jgi:isoquinoline 1-oxidoreductase beta subunit